MPDFLKPYWDQVVQNVLLNPYLAWGLVLLILFLIALDYFCKVVPQILILRSKILIPVAKKLKFKSLVKEAIKTDIEGNVNLTMQKLQSELPKEWSNPIDIEWVEKENNHSLNDDEVVIRMRPLENQDLNFVTAIYYCFKKAFFPKTKRVIPELTREAAVLYISHRLISTQKKDLVAVFQDKILEDVAHKRDAVLTYYNKYAKIDDFGFFTSAYLREIQEVANEVKFTENRKKMGQESAQILDHMLSFTRDLHNHSEEQWHRFGPFTSYGFLLVARPANSQIGGTKGYVERAKMHLAKGTKRLYVLGANDQKTFVENVIKSIEIEIPEYQLAEKFDLYKDYRGKPGGIAALFIHRK